MFSDVFNEVEIERALKIFVRRFFSQQFKRSCSPDGAKMMSFSLSPRTDLKIASDCNSDLFLAEM